MAHAIDATVDDRSLVLNRVRSGICRILDEEGSIRIPALARRLADRRAENFAAGGDAAARRAGDDPDTGDAARRHDPDSGDVAAHRPEFPADAIDRLSIALHHDHLPNLADRGVLEYRPDAGRVSMQNDVDVVEASIGDAVRVTDDG
ncbi:DUF7344 domain-containing protein [Halovivax limisalsi]|uniref:DUF7344 domain-containing protein n=1 Tax=Halovivax limisalsi TaxID=1453760 RepID=UPI001FFCF6CB|nr:hypothetical protein [Halovivax limisalsi]